MILKSINQAAAEREGRRGYKIRRLLTAASLPASLSTAEEEEAAGKWSLKPHDTEGRRGPCEKKTFDLLPPVAVGWDLMWFFFGWRDRERERERERERRKLH